MDIKRTNSESKLNFISRTDFTKGFSSWHIRWPVKISPAGNVSSCFDTIVKTDDGKTISINCQLGLSKFETYMGFGLFTKDKKLPVSTPFIYRLALCKNNDSNDVVVYNVAKIAFTNNDGEIRAYGHLIPVVEYKSLAALGDNLVFHFWLDIPNDIQKSAKKKQRGGSGDINAFKNLKDLSCDFTELFQSVLNGDDESKSLSDITLNIVSGNQEIQRQFYCHSYILAARSTVFKTMFANKQWKEGGLDGKERFVDINDVDGPTMEKILRHMYTGYLMPKEESEKEMSNGELLNLVHAAEKYFLHPVKEYCVKRLIYFAETDEERIEQFLVADQYRMPQLKAVCLATLRSNFESIDTTKYEIPNDLLLELLSAVAKRNIDLMEIRVEDFKRN